MGAKFAKKSQTRKEYGLHLSTMSEIIPKMCVRLDFYP